VDVAPKSGNNSRHSGSGESSSIYEERFLLLVYDLSQHERLLIN